MLSVSLHCICIWIFSGLFLVLFIMFKSMAAQIHWQSESHATSFASVDIVANMNSHVFVQITFVGIFSITMCALKCYKKEHKFSVRNWCKIIWISEIWAEKISGINYVRFSPVCVLEWAANLCFFWNFDEQIVQAYFLGTTLDSCTLTMNWMKKKITALIHPLKWSEKVAPLTCMFPQSVFWY